MNIFLKLFKIIKKAIKIFLIYFIGIPFCVFMRLISPFLKIRVGCFYGERIGHFAKDVELYLAEKTLNLNQKYLDLFFIGGRPANNFFLKLVKRKIFINKFFAILYEANKLLPNTKKYEFISHAENTGNTSDNKGLLLKTTPHLSFNKKENNLGNNFLKKIGCKKRFVCLIIRDSSYLKETFPEKNFSYHDYRDSDINTYIKGINYLLDEGFFVFRMGKIVKDSINIKHPNFIDYAQADFKNDFLDIWLMAKCDFCVSTSTGLDEICDIFRIPIVFVNALAIGNYSSWHPGCIWTPKTIVSKDDMKKLPLDEIIQNGAVGFPESGDYQDILDINNLSFIDNTEDDILESIVEMNEKVNGSWNFSKKRKDRQKLFWEKLKTWNRFSIYHDINQKEPIGILSDNYLEKNEDWFLK